VGEPKAIG